MAVALLSYFSTMVTAFAACMFFLASLLDTTTVRHPRPEPYKMSVAARAMLAERLATNASKQPETAQLQIAISRATASDAVAANDGGGRPMAAKQTQKARLLKLARDQKRKERLAGRRQDRGYSTVALGYAPESPERIAAERIFNTIRSRR